MKRKLSMERLLLDATRLKLLSTWSSDKDGDSGFREFPEKNSNCRRTGQSSTLMYSPLFSERYSLFVDGFLQMAYENLDTDLINELLGDGRASLRSLAETLDVSVTTVSNHLQDLEETGVIRGYSPTIDYDALGYDVTAIMQLTVDGSALSDVTESLREHRQILSVYEVTGGFDVIAIGKFRDTEDMNDQIKSLLNDSGINESNTSVVLNTVSEYEQFEIDTDISSSE